MSKFITKLKRFVSSTYGKRLNVNRRKQAIRTALVAFILLLVFTNVPANEKLIKQCDACHGSQGNSQSSFAPSIAGLQKYYMKWVVDAYINNNRPPGIMKDQVVNLTTEQISALADYYSQLKFKPVIQEYKKEMAQRGGKLHYQYCEKCHENGGAVSNNLPGLIAGQWMDYNRAVLKEYVEGIRKGNSMMKIKLDKMIKNEGPDSIEYLVHFYAVVK